MSNKIFTALALTALLAPAVAMAGHGHHGHHGQRMERMATELQLSDEQRMQLQTIMQQHEEKHRALRAELTPQINGILTTEQQVKFSAMQAEREKKWAEKRARHEGKPE